MKTLPKTKAGAIAAARKALGKEANEGVDFHAVNTGAGWAFEAGPGEVPTPAPKAKKAKAAPKPKATPAAVEAVAEVPKAPRAKRAPKVATEKKVSKAAQVRELLRRPEGADIGEVVQVTAWKEASAIWFIRGTLKKQGLTVLTTKEGAGEAKRTVYRIQEAAEPPV